MTSRFPFQLKTPDLLKTEAFVNGAWIPASSGKRFDVEDPGTGETFASCPDFDESDIDAVVRSSQEAFQHFRKENPRSRAEKLLAWDHLIRQNRDDLALVLTYEAGKPLAEAYAEIEYALGFTWWFAGEAERVRGNLSTPAAPNRRVLVVKQPIGVAAALVPWNFPIAMILRKVGAAFAAGLAEALCKHPHVKKVSFTGSTPIGSLIAKHCAEGLKKVTLELGGNCPFIIFDDCNQDQALEALLTLKWRHAGQACITANRVYIQEGIYEEFLTKLVERTKTIKLGHGADPETKMGPLTTPRAVIKAQAHIKDAVGGGARVAFGGRTGSDMGLSSGYYHEPTILRDVDQSMLISREETFAPVLGLLRFSTEDQVVEWANDTSMGLASYCFTKSVDRTWRMMENLEAGMIGMNTGNSSAAESPFGGMKQSGYGKESGKDVAVEEYLVSKTVTMTLENHY
uniref:Aldehyde dehydrogenase domain-containing protein n=1 Tax=Bionectria ochroleuca TaxID=29856 RepID=A0A0B7KSP2_BIOOC